MVWILFGTSAGLVLYVVGSQRRIERRLESIERQLGARAADWDVRR